MRTPVGFGLVCRRWVSSKGRDTTAGQGLQKPGCHLLVRGRQQQGGQEVGSPRGPLCCPGAGWGRTHSVASSCQPLERGLGLGEAGPPSAPRPPCPSLPVPWPVPGGPCSSGTPGRAVPAAQARKRQVGQRLARSPASHSLRPLPHLRPLVHLRVTSQVQPLPAGAPSGLPTDVPPLPGRPHPGHPQRSPLGVAPALVPDASFVLSPPVAAALERCTWGSWVPWPFTLHREWGPIGPLHSLPAT